jgi:nucleotide-binding universal stress UspA family protein
MPGEINKILYATDLTQNSTHALFYAMSIAVKYDAKIIGLHVIEELSINTPILLEGYVTQENLDRFVLNRKEYALERIEKRLDKVCQKRFPDKPDCKKRVIDFKVEVGFPAEVILRLAEEEGCDMIVMGTHGKGFITQTFLGSMAKRVLRRTRIPVFIIPLPEGETDLTVPETE